VDVGKFVEDFKVIFQRILRIFHKTNSATVRVTVLVQ